MTLINYLIFTYMKYDKVLHLLTGLFIGIIAIFFTAMFDLPTPIAVSIVAAAPLVAGVAKELRDYYSYGLFDWKDLAFSVVGTWVVLAIVWIAI